MLDENKAPTRQQIEERMALIRSTFTSDMTSTQKRNKLRTEMRTWFEVTLLLKPIDFRPMLEDLESYRNWERRRPNPSREV